MRPDIVDLRRHSGQNCREPMKITRKQLRRIIKEELNTIVEASSNIATSIEEKAAQIGRGYIVDLSNMEGSGGGDYPLYRVAGGKASLQVSNIGDLGYALSEENAGGSEPLVLGGMTIYLFPSDEEWQARNPD